MFHADSADYGRFNLDTILGKKSACICLNLFKNLSEKK